MQVYQWLRHWYPVGSLGELDERRPHNITIFGKICCVKVIRNRSQVLRTLHYGRLLMKQLLCMDAGKDLVLWRDNKGAWHAFEDACPHRLASAGAGSSMCRTFGKYSCTANWCQHQFNPLAGWHL
jgi:phenylpropionate dioxygenase-like ring-hydroxylating dioxygenase large terminal subunit